jgi:hypothetical protein
MNLVRCWTECAGGGGESRKILRVACMFELFEVGFAVGLLRPGVPLAGSDLRLRPSDEDLLPVWKQSARPFLMLAMQ